MYDENKDKDYDLNIEDIESCSFERAYEPRKILMIVTSADEFDDKHKTGVWFEEFAVPYNKFKDAGYIITAASPKGGAAPIDPASENIINDIKWKDAKETLGDTVPLETVDYTLYDAVVLPGGHGPMFDLAKSELMGEIISHFARHDKLIAAICHGPAGLLPAKQEDGLAFVDGRRVTCFTNDEEELAKKDKLVPFFLEDALKEQNAFFISKDDGEINIVEDANLITAQNFQSSAQFADAIIRYLSE